MHLIGRNTSFNVQKVVWLLNELNLDYEHTELGGRFGGLDAPEFGDKNPHRKVPVLEDGPLCLWESHAILRYLSATYGDAIWWPADPGKRAMDDRWLDWQATRLQPDFMALFWGYYREPEPTRDMRAVNAARDRCRNDYELLDQILAGQAFLSGEHFGLADIPAGATLYRYFGMGLDVPEPANVMRWYAALKERPAFAQCIMVPFDELFGRSDF
ncbi:MAG: glutathione S-transferase family protein [Pseudomonadota bacterium]